MKIEKKSILRSSFGFLRKILRRSKKKESKKESKIKKKGKVKIVNGTRVIYYPSDRQAKKWMTFTPDGKKVHWGDPNMKDYTQHHSKIRRKNYRTRHAGVLLKDGTRAIDKKWSPAWLSYYVTW